MFLPVYREHVHKAAPRRKWAATRTYKRLDALSKQMGNVVSLDLARGLKKFKGKVDPEKVYQAWLKGDYHQVVDSIPWQDFSGDVGPAFEKVKAGMGQAWGIAAESLPAPEPMLRFDLKNPKIVAWINSRKALNFTNLSEDSARNIRSMVSQSFARALTPRQVADQIKSSIGLLPRHQVAVDRYRQGLFESGTPPQQAARLAGQYADRLLDYRAMMIGRTETRFATNQGQLAVWQQAVDQDLIDKETVRKVWIVDGDPCELCEPMDGEAVPLDSSWVLSDGSICMVPTDSHPHCECGMEMEYGSSEEEAA